LNLNNPAVISEMTASSPSPLPRWAVFACYGAVTLFLLTPLFFVQHPQSVDLANHLARQFARNMPHQGVFEYHWMLFPYLVFDVLAAGLMHFFSLYDTGRIILGLAYVVWVAAPVMLYRALWKEWGLWPLLAALVAYNGNTVWGFAAYSITAGAGVLLLAAWIMTEACDTGARAWMRVAVFSVLAFLVYLGHLTGFTVFGLLIGLYEVNKLYAARQLNIKNLVARGLRLAPLGLPAMAHFAYVSLKFPPKQNVLTLMPQFGDRLATICSPFFDGLQTEGGHIVPHIDYPAAFMVVATVVYLLLNRAITMHALVMPALLLGISFIHYRLPFLAVALAIASSRVRISVPAARVIATCFAAALLLRGVAVESIWQAYDGQVRELIAQSEMIKPGDRVLVVNRQYDTSFIEHYHTGSFLTIERQAFVPNLFVVMQFFMPVGDYARLSHATATHPIDARLLQLALDHSPALDMPEAEYFRTWWRDFDYVVAWEHDVDDAFYPAQLTPVAEGSFFKIYKVKKAG
jgi:hypothetical protein